jgi:hypothetical protein
MPKIVIAVVVILVVLVMYVGAQLQMGMDDILYPERYQMMATATSIAPAGTINGGDVFVNVTNNCPGIGNNCTVSVVAAADQSQDSTASNTNSNNTCGVGGVLVGGVCVSGMEYQYGQGDSQQGGG